MNKAAIKNFAIWARRKLISEITYKAGLLGITEKAVAEPLPQSTKDLQFFDIGTKDYTQIAEKEIGERNALVSRIKSKAKSSDYQSAFQSVVEEVAYTWFNRLIAVRFMEVNDYLPSRIRVLSSENAAKSEPDFVTTPFDTDLDFSDYDRDRIMQLKDENKLDELFRMLFIKQCNKLNDILSELFEKTDDYTELLLNISFTDKDGVVNHLVQDIEEGDFNVEKEGQIEIIGWMYQYYNTEPKNEVFALLKKNVKITKEHIPAATQLFTPDWIVRYMVENSLGRLWIEGHPNDSLKSNWKYYLDEAEQEPDVKAQLEKIRAEYKTINPEQIKVIDPCMGSGHILVYAFDVLMQIYESYGYTQRDATSKIIEYNLYGLDIDDRAYQLAYFAVMMKARQYNRRILNDGIRPNLCAIQESNDFNPDYLSLLKDDTLQKDASYLLTLFTDAKEYGSILNVDIPAQALAALRLRMDEVRATECNNIFDSVRRAGLLTLFEPLLRQAEVMVQKYDAVVTNPPYMGGSGMGAKLSDFVKTNYPDSKSDLFAVFIEKCGELLKPTGYEAMITQHAWMFLSSYEKLRGKLIHRDIMNMAHLGARAFEEIGGEVVQTTAFVLSKRNIADFEATYVRLVDYNSQQAKEEAFLSGGDRHTAKKENFEKIPSSPVVYWVSEAMLRAFEAGKPIEHYSIPRQGMGTGDNNRFLRLWWEIEETNIGFEMRTLEEADDSNKKWFPYNKGGEFRKWYGNNEYVVNFQNDGREVKASVMRKYPYLKTPDFVIKNTSYFFKECITWSQISSGSIAFRYKPDGFITGGGAASIFLSQSMLYYLQGACNSKVVWTIATLLSPTLNFEINQVKDYPIITHEQKKQEVIAIVEANIELSKVDWDSFETSWDFITHPLITYKCGAGYADVPMEKWQYRIENAFDCWKSNAEEQFNLLKRNEEELNRIFIDIYGLQNELTPEVVDKDVTVRSADLGREIRSLISYAVGCMFGRYSLDVEGLAYAGGEWDAGKYKTFPADRDNILPICDDEYFDDDIVGQFVDFIRVVYGESTLEENLKFIADALSGKGTPREVIRNYFLNDFYKDHLKIYQKRPIYWLFDSGKKNGFKALIYMHRYNADTIGNLRIEYLHRMQRVYESEITRMQETIDNSTNTHEVVAAEKRKEKLIKQLKETKDYDAKVAHLAVARIDLDLDDGVKVNYEKVQTGTDGKMLDVLAKI